MTFQQKVKYFWSVQEKQKTPNISICEVFNQFQSILFMQLIELQGSKYIKWNLALQAVLSYRVLAKNKVSENLFTSWLRIDLAFTLPSSELPTERNTTPILMIIDDLILN